ncbi:MAG: outer membrane protein assembly factor BamA [Vicinamibacteria bacterium]|nr:outer membrane protein assembly factor BamA [Vicinamibacteria bacterium]
MIPLNVVERPPVGRLFAVNSKALSKKMRAGTGIIRLLLASGALVVAYAPGAGFAELDSPEDAAVADAPIIESVDIQQNQYVRKESFLYYVSTRPGDRYDERRLKADFRRLWDTGLLDDLLLDVSDGATGKRVVFVVRERKRVMIVDYRGSKAVSRKSIEDKLKEEDVKIPTDSLFDVTKTRKIEGVIRGMLEEQGHPFGTVKHQIRAVGGGGAQLTFEIDDGPKTKVKEIEFLGNKVFSDGRLRGAMKKIKKTGFWNLTWLLGKTTYTEEKWREDQENLRDFYLNHGYVTASIGEPTVSTFDEESADPKKKPKRFIKIEIPVHEGEQYRVGDVKFEGLTVFREEPIRQLFKLKTGDVYKESRIKKGYEKLRDLYGAQGYLGWTPLTKREPDPERRVVDVVLGMQEDKRYFVGRIDFTGNTVTRDKVIRREVFMNEGEVFNTEALKLSLKRINQLGYFKPIEKEPSIRPGDRGEDRLDVTFDVEEQSRNQFTLGGGVSGYEGTFINSSFSTTNFLGTGETFQVNFQSGKRIKNYQFAVTEPFFLDRPISAGFDLYRRRIEYIGYHNYQGYSDDRIGGSVTAGLPVSRFTRLYAGYTYEVVDIKQIELELNATGYDPTLTYGYVIEDEGRRYESRVSPSLIYNTVDNPYTPRSGTRITGSMSFSGGPLGGTLNYFRPRLEIVKYLPHTRHTALGLHLEGALVKPFGTTAVVADNGRDKLPFYHRYALGGEMQVRGYPIYSIMPYKDGDFVRGDKYLLFNAEYYLDVIPMVRLLAFFDAAQVLLDGESLDRLKYAKVSTGVELRFTMPVLNVPLRLIYARNPNRGRYADAIYRIDKDEFKFAVGTTF